MKAGLLKVIILALLKLLIIGIDPEKMTPVLNHVVGTEGAQCH